MPTRRVTVIAHELRGFHPAGGMGTATTSLALALAELGHSVEILLGKHSPSAIDTNWRDVYDRAGVRITPVPPSERVEPWEFEHTHKVALGLQANPADVVIAHDLGAPAYAALRLKQAGLAFEDTLFVVFCHGPRRYVADLSPRLAIGDLHAVLGVSLLEQAAVELADVVVSPSAYLAEWMRKRGWNLPEDTRVIPYLTEKASRAASVDGPVRRLAYFGRVDEKKGLRLFAAALHALDRDLLADVDIELVGKTTRTWTRERVEALLRGIPNVSFATGLDQREALARLSRPGTLVVMPSLQENSPNTVYECLAKGIPFIASNVGGVPELIAEQDRARVLFEPTADALAAALSRVLAERHVPAPARPAFDRRASLESWSEVVAVQPRARNAHNVDDEADVVFLGMEGTPDPRLVHALHATNADVVTCAVRVENTLHFFAGDPGGLGAIRNGYGTVALCRRSVLERATDLSPRAYDPSWPLLAELAMAGAQIVSVPLPLATSQGSPGNVDNDPAGAVLVAKRLERALPDPVRGAARIAAGLAHQDDQPPSTTRFEPVT
jgi:glycosyltransferase involved in cell wall biosynthesis